MVGLSGGKDSLVLLTLLKDFLKTSKYKYPLAAGCIDLGLGADYGILADFCRELDVPFYLEKTDIGKIIFEVRKEKNPCSLCAKMRRGALNDLAKSKGYSKVALGHNREDYLETYLMNLFYAGSTEKMKPLTLLDRSGVTVIRPMLAVPEELLRKHSSQMNYPVIKNPCPADGNTNREEMRLLLEQMETSNPKSLDNCFRALIK